MMSSVDVSIATVLSAVSVLEEIRVTTAAAVSGTASAVAVNRRI